MTVPITDRRTAVPGMMLASGWRAKALTPASALFGANGIRLGPDGRLYVAEAFGNRISAIDITNRSIMTICDVGNPIVAPDDMAFDSRGTMYVPDVMSATVSARMRNGAIRVVAADLPCANGITVHQDRIFMDECRAGGRLAEIFPDGSEPRILAENLPAPNALAVGPDGHLYFPLVTENEIWRVPLAGGSPERFVDGLGVPTAVKFDGDGNLLTVQAATGEVLRFDVATGRRSLVARLRPGLDNLDISADGRIFVSHYIDGGVEELASDGSEIVLAAPGMLGPHGLALSPADGVLYVCDGLSVIAVAPDGNRHWVGHRMDGAFPGWVRGIAVRGDGSLLVTTAEGGLFGYRPDSHEVEPLATHLEEAIDVSLAGDGSVLFTEAGTGALIALRAREKRTVAAGLSRPMGLAISNDGTAYVAEAVAGRVVAITHDGVTPVIEGLVEPHGLAVVGDTLFALDVGTRRLIACDLRSRTQSVVATGLPIGSPPGTIARVQPGIPGRIPGPLSAFAGLAAGPDGTLYIAANGSGMVMTIRRAPASQWP